MITNININKNSSNSNNKLQVRFEMTESVRLSTTEAEKPPFMKVVPWAAIIIGTIIVALVLVNIQWQMADDLGLGWNQAYYVRSVSIMVGLGIVIPAIVITLAIVGSKIYEQSDIITLLFGIAFAALGTLLMIATAIQIGNNISEYFDKLGDGVEFFYPIFSVLAAAGVGVSLMIGLAGKRVISYYYEKLAT